MATALLEALPASEPAAADATTRCDGVEITAGTSERRCLKPGAGKSEQFKDCVNCPEMVVVPAGSFTMGSPADEPDPASGRESQVYVTIAKPFAVGRHAVTLGEFAAFVTATDHKTDGGCFVQTFSGWNQEGYKSWRWAGFWQTDRHPVVCVNWHDAKAYVAWLSATTGKSYRLLSEAEREYVARASTSTPFWWGSAITPAQANYDGTAEPYKGGGAKGEYRKATLAGGQLRRQPLGPLQCARQRVGVDGGLLEREQHQQSW
jgi:formylglycine-generating enzyme required for sulfatase activity